MTAADARRLGKRELFDRLERLLIETRGNIAEMGRRMGKDRSTIRYHLRRFGMLGEGHVHGPGEGHSEGRSQIEGRPADRAAPSDPPSADRGEHA